jgi:hypothetical protein
MKREFAAGNSLWVKVWEALVKTWPHGFYFPNITWDRYREGRRVT